MKVILLNNSPAPARMMQYLKRVTMNVHRGIRSDIHYTSDLDEARKFKTVDEANEYMNKYGLTRMFHTHVVDRL